MPRGALPRRYRFWGPPVPGTGTWSPGPTVTPRPWRSSRVRRSCANSSWRSGPWPNTGRWTPRCERTNTVADLVKCLVWDLDHTLWPGTLLEDGETALTEGVRDVIVELDE